MTSMNEGRSEFSVKSLRCVCKDSRVDVSESAACFAFMTYNASQFKTLQIEISAV